MKKSKYRIVATFLTVCAFVLAVAGFFAACGGNTESATETETETPAVEEVAETATETAVETPAAE